MHSEHLHQFDPSDGAALSGGKQASETPRENPAGERAGEPETVLALICETCGKDYFFDSAPPPERMSCAKCGGRVFRPFETTVGDEVLDDFRDSTERDLSTDAAEGETLPGDVMDLNNI